VSEENVETLKRIYKGWAAGDMSAGASDCDPHMVAVLPDPSPVVQYGQEAVSQYLRQFLQSWKEIRFEATAYRESGDTVVVEVHRSGIGQRSGVSVEDNVFHLWTFRGGRVIRMDIFEREAKALEAAGLSE
jgi:ketosteroid isomerase-like protein